MDLRGATRIAASEGLGPHHRIHSVHLFELAEPPVSIVLPATQEQAERRFARLSTERLELCYVKAAVEFGVTGIA